MEAAAFLAPLRHRVPHRFGDGGAMRGQLLEEVLHAEGEYPSVPGIDAFGQERLRALQIGLLDEAGDAEAEVADRLAALEIAEAGFGRLRLYAEGHQPALARQGRRRARRAGERRAIGDMVVAGADQHHRILGQAQRGKRDGGGGVLRRRLDDDRRCRVGTELRLDVIEMGAASDDDGRAEARLRAAPRDRCLEQGAVTDERQEGLRPCRAATGPEARAAAAAKNDGNDLFAHG